MMASELLAKVEAILCKVDIAESYRFALIVRNHEVLCVPSRHLQIDDFFIHHVTRQHISDGFTGREWDDILTKMVRLQKEGLI